MTSLEIFLKVFSDYLPLIMVKKNTYLNSIGSGNSSSNCACDDCIIFPLLLDSGRSKAQHSENYPKWDEELHNRT